jgi:hypothetical protein
MTGASSLAFPASRKLAGWWRQLAPYQPRSLWVGHLVFHQVEALVRLTHLTHPDAVTLFLLRALALDELKGPADQVGPLDTIDRLDRRLHLGRQIMGPALRELAAAGLAQSVGDGPWTLTPLGRHALEHGAYPRPAYERRTFHFLESGMEGTGGTYHFLDLHHPSSTSLPVAEGQGFDVHALQGCLTQPPEWKRAHGFPGEVEEIVRAAPGPEKPEDQAPAGPPLWQRVILDRPEMVLVVLVQTTSDGMKRLLALAVRQDGWVLQTGEPVFTLGQDWPTVFPDLADGPPLEAWRQVWQEWSESRGLPPAEVEACTLEREGVRLCITAPTSLIERLRATRSDALKGETWLLAGAGRIRAAALVELQPEVG